uniref:Uncharacterized protein n=1 Tax=Romanomermis culicivorax TaxID=13658 RepID=A0A915IFG7_ROMCU
MIIISSVVCGCIWAITGAADNGVSKDVVLAVVVGALVSYNLDINQNTGYEHIRVHFTGLGLIKTDDDGFRGQHKFIECVPIIGSSCEGVKHDISEDRYLRILELLMLYEA